MKLRIGLCVFCAVVVAACGGSGGGGGGVPEPSNPPDPGGDPTPGNATAAIVFPWHRSAATASTVLVRGTASDPKGVEAVHVNGVPATLTTPTAAGIGSAGPAGEQAPGRFATTMSESGSSDDHETVEWEVEIELDDGDNDIVVTVEDADGGVTDEADAVQIRYHEVPAVFAFDPDRTRVVGLSFTLTPTGYAQRLVEHNYASGVQTVFANMSGAPMLTCLRGHANEFLRLVEVEQDLWELHGYHLGTGQGAIIAAIPADVRDPGEGFEPAPFLRRLVCSDDHVHAYALANYVASEGGGFGSGGFAKSRVWRILLADGQVDVLTESDESESPPWLAMDVALSGDVLVGLADINPIAPLTAISLDDGERSELTSDDVGGLALVAQLDQNLVYVATLDGVDRIELGPPQTKVSLPAVDAQDPFVFAQVGSIAYDMANTRLIVGDSDVDALIAVDATTGERSDFLSRRIGTGPPVLAPRRIVLTADQTGAYVADDGGNATERLFLVDLQTGDREQIGDISESANAAINGLSIDEAGGLAWVSRHTAVLEVDLESGFTRALARLESEQVGSVFQMISTVALDAAHDRLLVGDSVLEAIVAIDLQSETQEIFSQHGEQGDGDPLGTVTSISIDEAGGIAYVSDQSTNSIVTVDLENGDRELFPTSCPIDTEPETLQRVVHDPVHDQLLIVGDGLFIHDLGTGGCAEVLLRTDIDDVQIMDDGRLLVTTLRAVAQLDRPSGHLVIISR